MSIALTIVLTLIVGAAAMYLGANVATTEKRLLYRPRRLYTSKDADFKRALGILLGPPLVAGNRVTTLVNGDQIFPAMLDAIRTAKVSVTFETFVFRDAIGCEFCQALSDAARRGVKVHILLDWLGSSSMDGKLLSATREAGCELELYHKLSWYHLGRLNNRTHRKLLIVDGQIGFTGGVGMGHEWLGNAQDPQHWRETHYRAEGPVVSQMQAVWAAQALYGALLRAGAEVYEYQPTMIHSKVMVIDEMWTSVGSANFDDRSFRLNDEANLNVFSAGLAREQIELIEHDIAQSKRMAPRRWARRAITRRFYEQLALLLRSQL